jgi:hypothetical protein
MMYESGRPDCRRHYRGGRDSVGWRDRQGDQPYVITNSRLLQGRDWLGDTPRESLSVKNL